MEVSGLGGSLPEPKVKAAQMGRLSGIQVHPLAPVNVKACSPVWYTTLRISNE